MFITMMMLGRCQLCRCAHRHICRSRAGTDVACALLARAGTREGRARRGVFAAAESLAISAHAAENTVVAVVAVVAAALGNRSSVTVPGEQVGARKRAAVGCGDREVIAARAVKVGALRGDAPHRRCTTHAVAAALLRLGWMLPARQACESAPGEAPELEGAEWRWTLPRCGAMVLQLVAARTQLLRVLHRQRFGRALRSFVETKIAQGAAAAPLPFGFVLRDLQGNELVSEREAGGGAALLELTAAGKQAAERVARKRRR